MQVIGLDRRRSHLDTLTCSDGHTSTWSVVWMEHLLATCHSVDQTAALEQGNLTVWIEPLLFNTV